MRNCGQRNVRKHREFKDSDERVTLNMNEILKISEEFDNLDNMETTSSESKVKMEGSGKWLVVNMRNCGKRNLRKHREIKDSDERVTLKAYKNMYEILKFSEKFNNLDKMETTSSESR